MRYNLDKTQVRMLIAGKVLRSNHMVLSATPEVIEGLKEFDSYNAYDKFIVVYDTNDRTLTIKERT